MTNVSFIAKVRLGRANSSSVAIGASALFIVMVTVLGSLAPETRLASFRPLDWPLRGTLSVEGLVLPDHAVVAATRVARVAARLQPRSKPV